MVSYVTEFDNTLQMDKERNEHFFVMKLTRVNILAKSTPGVGNKFTLPKNRRNSAEHEKGKPQNFPVFAYSDIYFPVFLPFLVDLTL